MTDTSIQDARPSTVSQAIAELDRGLWAMDAQREGLMLQVLERANDTLERLREIPTPEALMRQLDSDRDAAVDALFAAVVLPTLRHDTPAKIMELKVRREQLRMGNDPPRE